MYNKNILLKTPLTEHFLLGATDIMSIVVIYT